MDLVTRIIKEGFRRYVYDKYIAKYILILKYSVGGAAAFVVDATLLYVFTEYANIWYLTSSILSFLIASIVNYVYQRLVTFKHSGTNIKKQYLSFLLIAAVGLGLNTLLLWVQVELLGLWYMLAKAIAAVIVLVWNFEMNKYFTFK